MFRWRARLSAPDRTGPGSHPASCTMVTGSFPEVKRPGRGVDHPPSSSAEDEEGVELYLCSISGPTWPALGKPLPLPATLIRCYITFTLEMAPLKYVRPIGKFHVMCGCRVMLLPSEHFNMICTGVLISP